MTDSDSDIYLDLDVEKTKETGKHSITMRRDNMNMNETYEEDQMKDL